MLASQQHSRPPEQWSRLGFLLRIPYTDPPPPATGNIKYPCLSGEGHATARFMCCLLWIEVVKERRGRDIPVVTHRRRLLDVGELAITIINKHEYVMILRLDRFYSPGNVGNAQCWA